MVPHPSRRALSAIPDPSRLSSLLCLLVLLLAPAALDGQDVTLLQGTVRDGVTGVLLEDALVSVSGTPDGTHTLSDGTYELTVAPGTATITVSRPGYITRQVTMSLPAAQVLTQDFTLDQAQQQPILTAATTPLREGDFSEPFVPDVTLRSRQVDLAPFLPVVGQTIELELFPDEVVQLRADRVEGDSTYFQWTGHVMVGDAPIGSALLVWRPPGLTGDIRFQGRVFELVPLEGSVHLVVELDPTGPLFEPDPESPEIPGPPLPPEPEDPFFPDIPRFLPVPSYVEPFGALWHGSPQPVCEDISNLWTGPLPEVRILVLYTQEAAAAAGNILSEIDALIMQLNFALEWSDTPVRATLAFTREVDVVDESGVGALQHLKQLRDPGDGVLDYVHALRTRRHADLTMLIVQNTAGGGAAETWENVTLDFADLAFGVANRTSAFAHLAFVHEVGHLLGGHHDRAGGGDIFLKPYRYNHGFRPAGSDFVTVMARLLGNNEWRELVFSNPDLALSGTVLGVPSNAPLAADNRRAITNVGGVVSALRLTPVWMYSAGAMAPWTDRRTSRRELDEVRFADLDGDGETDAFRVDEGAGTWHWSRSASGPWRVLNGPDASLAVSIDDLALGDFDDDGKADVFGPAVGAGEWLWSPGGTGAWQVLNGGSAPALGLPMSQLALGDFDADGRTDVFRSNQSTGEWFVSFGGTGAWQSHNGPSASLAYAVSDLGFGDFDGDGTEDVFVVDPTTHRWRVSSGGSATLSEINNYKAQAFSDLALGDFDGDGTTDVLTTTGQHWMVAWSGEGAWQVVRKACQTLPRLGFGDFDGDGTTDVIRLGIRP